MKIFLIILFLLLLPSQALGADYSIYSYSTDCQISANGGSVCVPTCNGYGSYNCYFNTNKQQVVCNDPNSHYLPIDNECVCNDNYQTSDGSNIPGLTNGNCIYNSSLTVSDCQKLLGNYGTVWSGVNTCICETGYIMATTSDSGNETCVQGAIFTPIKYLVMNNESQSSTIVSATPEVPTSATLQYLLSLQSPIKIHQWNFQRTLNRGMTNAQVYLLQKFLDSQHFNLTTTGYFGNFTQAAIKEFQKDNSLKVTGVFDSSTLEFVNNL